jgi:[protein-PII] uridylyltransferase
MALPDDCLLSDTVNLLPPSDATVRGVPEESLRSLRDQLIASPDIDADGFARAYTEAADEWLADLVEHMLAPAKGTYALLAVGGYGRGELAPYSDLDLVLVHNAKRGFTKVAERLWYPIWDEGIGLDHSVRTPDEVIVAAKGDLRVALGLLDARCIGGSTAFADAVLSRVQSAWRGDLAALHLDDLESQMRERHLRYGDLAFLLEPDLKEARGGLRDAAALEAFSRFSDALGDAIDLEETAEAAAAIRGIRVALQRATRRASDRLVLQDHDSVAASLGLPTPDLLRQLSGAARRIGSAIDEAWRRRSRWDPMVVHRPAPATLLEPGIEEKDGEVFIAEGAALDAAAALRIAAVGARHRLPIASETARSLASSLLERPPGSDLAEWTPGMTEDLISTLQTGTPSIEALETLDLAGVLSQLLPEWEAVRHFHQRNAYHRFTADRHLLETAANAADLADSVIRPDLLVLGALLHDIGKGRGGDHTEIGVELVGTIASRLGLAPADKDLLVGMVRHHLLLPDTATRRDLSDPATARAVAEAVGSVELLELLGALAAADGLATGPSAWSPWKAGLVVQLVDAANAVLIGEALEVPPATETQLSAATQAREAGHPVVSIHEDRVVIAAPDRVGLLATAAGVLCLAGLDVRSADARSVDELAVDEFAVVPGPRGIPPAGELEDALVQTLAGRRELGPAIEARARAYPPKGAARSTVVTSADQDASDRATVVEVRAPDRVGLLWHLARAIADAGLDVTAARVVSLGTEAIDVFYVREQDGTKLSAERVETLLEVLAASGTVAVEPAGVA